MHNAKAGPWTHPTAAAACKQTAASKLANSSSSPRTLLIPATTPTSWGVGSRGTQGSFHPSCCRLLSPFRWLHTMHAVTRFCQLLTPPLRAHRHTTGTHNTGTCMWGTTRRQVQQPTHTCSRDVIRYNLCKQTDRPGLPSRRRHKVVAAAACRRTCKPGLCGPVSAPLLTHSTCACGAAATAAHTHTLFVPQDATTLSKRHPLPTHTLCLDACLPCFSPHGQHRATGWGPTPKLTGSGSDRAA